TGWTTLVIILTQAANFVVILRRQKISGEHMNMPITMAIMFCRTKTEGFIVVLSRTFAEFFPFSVARSLTLMKFWNGNIFKTTRSSNSLNVINNLVEEVIYSF